MTVLNEVDFMKLIKEKKTFQLNFIILFFSLSFFSGIFTYMSYFLDNEYLKIWKEIYIILIYIVAFDFKLKKIDVNSIIISLFIGSFFFIEIIYSWLLEIPASIILYQLKNDLLLVLFFICIYNLFLKINYEDIMIFSKKIIKIMIFLGVINAIAMIFEFIFFEQFLNLIGLDMGNWGTAAGVKIITSGSYLRPIGLQSGFVQASNLVLISFIVMNENKIYNIKNKKMKYIINLIFFIAIMLSTYATAIIGFILYVIMKLINKKFKLNLFFILSIILFLFFLYTTHGLGVYEFIYTIYPDKADTSILFRIEGHWDIINDLSKNIISFLLGTGLGVNGIVGLDKELYGIISIATDSAYIYLFSNYGIIGVVAYVFILIYYMIKFNKNDILGIESCLFYILIVDFFFNNTVATFPINFFIVLLINLALRLRRIS